MNNILEIKDVTLQFGGLKALDNINISIDKGEIRGLIGPNGSGKSSLINIISSVYKPTQGNVIFNREDITDLSPHQTTSKGISRTFQNIRLFPELSVLENVLTGGHCKSKANLFQVLFRTRQMRDEEFQLIKKALHYIELIGLAGYEQVAVNSFPHGQQKLIEIARALMSDPLLVLLDEPTAGLSPQETEEVVQIVNNIRDDGVTIIVVEHKMKFVLGISDSMTVLNSGVKIAEGTPSEIQKDPDVIKAYLGTEVNYASA